MIDIVITAVYLIAVLIVGIRAAKNVNSIEEFSVAGRSFSYLVIFATLSASFIGGGFSMGNAEKVFLFGLVNIFALWGFSLKEILVAQFIAPKSNVMMPPSRWATLWTTIMARAPRCLREFFQYFSVAGFSAPR